MQRYFLDDYLISVNSGIIENDDFHHIKNVMRFSIGEKILINTYSGKLFLSEITSYNKKSVEFKIIEELKTDYQPSNLDIGLSLIKKDNFEIAIKKITELNISGIIPLKTERSIIKIDDFDKRKDRIKAICKEASEQSERLLLPLIYDIHSLQDVVNLDYELKLFAYAREKDNHIKTVIEKIKTNKKVLCLIGPEGGFSKNEYDFLVKNNFLPVSLGKTILRVETAAIFVAAVFNYHHGGSIE